MANVTTLLIAPTTFTLGPTDTARAMGFAFDDSGTQQPIPNGTQVRVDDSTVASASLLGSVVTITGRTAGSTGVRLTKGNTESNTATVSVVTMPAAIVIRF